MKQNTFGLILSFTLLFSLSSLSQQNTNDSIYNSDKIYVGLLGKKSISTEFNLVNPVGQYKIVVTNGSGKNITLEDCKLKFPQNVLCQLRNLTSRLKLLTERTLQGEVTVNGQIIFSKIDLNLKANQLSTFVNLQKNNNINISILGIPTSYIKVEVFSDAPQDANSISFASPIDQSIVSTETIKIDLVAHSLANNLRVVCQNDGIAFENITPEQTISHTYPYLEIGANKLRFQLYSGAQLLSTKDLNIVYIPEGTSGSIINANGGNLEIADSNSSLYGARMEIQPNSLDAPTYINISYGDYWEFIPFGKAALGPAVSFLPYLQYFKETSKLIIPFDPQKIPQGTNLNSIKVFGYNGDKPVEITDATIGSNSAIVEKSSIEYYAYQVMADIPLNAGDLQIDSNVGGATVYIDGIFLGDLVPTVLTQLSPGEHTLKFYLPGYNEILQKINYTAAAQKISITLNETPNITPTIILDGALIDGMSTDANLIEIKGQVSGNSFSSNDFVVLTQNSSDTMLPLNSDGSFNFITPLFKGVNKIQIRATVSGITGLSSIININKMNPSTAPLLRQKKTDTSSAFEQDDYSNQIRAEKIRLAKSQSASDNTLNILLPAAIDEEPRVNQEIKVTMSWDTDNTDADLHIYDNYGGHASYEKPDGIEQGILDRDDVDGYGPEIFTLSRPRPGVYRIQVKYYGETPDGDPLTASIKVHLAGNLIYQGSHKLNAPGDSWEAYSIVIWNSNLSISNIETQGGRSSEPLPKVCQNYQGFTCLNYILTTLPDESSISVTTEASGDILDSDIYYRVNEKTTGTTITPTSTGRNISFSAMVGPQTTEQGAPLIYEIIAYTNSGMASDPYYVVQDIKSQIRQEYIDKKKAKAGFSIPTPNYSNIHQGFLSIGPNVYTFRQMVAGSDFINHSMGIVDLSISYANTIFSAYRDAYENKSLRLTSAWRNPKRNDSLKNSVINSFHQSGNAVDFVVNQTMTNPNVKIDDEGNLIELCELAFRVTNGTDVIYHAGHVHIEKSTGGRIKRCSSIKLK